jgi:hypothetical protein
MGIGYVIPENMTKAEFRAEYAKWEQKLKDSNFEDLEYRALNGKVTSYFKRNGSTATFQMIYDPAIEEYFSLARAFNAYMNEKPYTTKRNTRWSVQFQGQALLYKTLWRLHIDGVPYRAVAKAFSGMESHWMKNIEPVPAELVSSYSVFWAHEHTHKILDLFWAWAAEQGYKDPRQSSKAE